MNEKEPKGEDKYHQLVDICRSYKVFTPEDEYLKITLDDRQYIIVPSFTLYDYSFRPNKITFEQAVDWAAESGVICTDKDLLLPYPYYSIAEWCQKRCEYTESRLAKLPVDIPKYWLTITLSLKNMQDYGVFRGSPYGVGQNARKIG